jgi:hypothetical protein
LRVALQHLGIVHHAVRDVVSSPARRPRIAPRTSRDWAEGARREGSRPHTLEPLKPVLGSVLATKPRMPRQRPPRRVRPVDCPFLGIRPRRARVPSGAGLAQRGHEVRGTRAFGRSLGECPDRGYRQADPRSVPPRAAGWVPRQATTALSAGRSPRHSRLWRLLASGDPVPARPRETGQGRSVVVMPVTTDGGTP